MIVDRGAMKGRQEDDEIVYQEASICAAMAEVKVKEDILPFFDPLMSGNRIVGGLQVQRCS